MQDGDGYPVKPHELIMNNKKAALMDGFLLLAPLFISGQAG